MRITVAVWMLLAPIVAWAGEGRVRHSAYPVVNEYIVALDRLTPVQDVEPTAKAIAKQYGGSLQKVWTYAVKGFFVTMPAARAAQMSADPRVRYVEENARSFSSTTQPANFNPACISNCAPTSDDREWHLDRIDQSSPALDNQYNYCNTGSGVTVYVVDTGVMRAHSEFIAANVKDGFDASSDRWVAGAHHYAGDRIRAASGDVWVCVGPIYPGQYSGSTQPDWPSTLTTWPDGGLTWRNFGKHDTAYDPCHGTPVFASLPLQNQDDTDYKNYNAELLAVGHGTAVASLVAGQHTGVAKNATLVPVKTMRCDIYEARRWQANHPYAYGDRIVGASLHQWICTVAGTSGGTQPAWSTLGGDTVTEPGGPTWVNVAESNVADGTTQMLIDGVNWILDPANTNPVDHSVATFSRYVIKGDPLIGTFEEAVQNLINHGVTVIASANNQNDDACNTSPARLSRDNPDQTLGLRKVITAGGSMLTDDPDGQYRSGDGGPLVQQTEPAPRPGHSVADARWVCGAGDSDGCTAPIGAYNFPNFAYRKSYAETNAGSNWGDCVTLFAPAKNITSARPGNNYDYRDRTAPTAVSANNPIAALSSGTSFSAPVTAGAAARFLELYNNATPDDVYNALVNSSVKNALDAATLQSRNNRLLHATDVWIYSTAAPAPVVLPANSNTTLTVSAVGTGTLSFQWYEGALNDTSTPRAASASQLVTVSGTKTFWCRAWTTSCNGGLSSVDSPLYTVSAGAISAPGSFIATTDSSDPTHVNVSWAASTGAVQYQLQRGTSVNNFADVGAAVGGTSVVDAPSVTGTPAAYLYRVVAIDGNGTRSVPSALDYATVATTLFTDTVLQTSQTPVRAQQMTQLRAAVDAVRGAAGLSAMAWQPLTVVSGAGFNEVRTSLDQARTTLGLPAYTYSASVNNGSEILALHMSEMRAGVR